VCAWSSSRPVQGETGCKEVVAQPNVLRVEVVREVIGEKIVVQRNIFQKSLKCATELSGVASVSYAFRYPHRLRGHLCAVCAPYIQTNYLRGSAKDRGFKSPLIVGWGLRANFKKEIEMEKKKKLYSFRPFHDELKKFKAIAVKKRTTASNLLRELMRAEIALGKPDTKTHAPEIAQE
jgi:hypothetical protein